MKKSHQRPVRYDEPLMGESERAPNAPLIQQHCPEFQ
jgi:hypothetical protein